MKIGFYCESPIDQAAMTAFTEGILGEPPEPIEIDLEARTQPAFFSALDVVYRGVHFSQAEGLVLVADCDRKILHETDHDQVRASGDGCRYCRIRQIIDRAQAQLAPRKNRPALKVAIGLTVPIIEAWYLAEDSHQVGEAAWKVGLASGRVPFNGPQLKKLVYGTERPSFELALEKAVEHAKRVSQNLAAIEAAFPIGFGLMAKEIRSWSQK